MTGSFALKLILLALLCQPDARGQYALHPLDPERVAWVENTLSKLTPEEKVGQLIIPGLSGRFINRTARAFEQVQSNIREFHVGGFLMLGGDLAGTAILINRMQQIADVPLLIAADLEGGPGFQFPGGTRLPRGMALGATGNPDLAYEAARITALEGRQLGIHVNFYPVVDVNNNPRNPIINIRSFGEDVRSVMEMTKRYIEGTQQFGMLATAKHFPGHGDTWQDSHMELPAIAADRARLDAVELPPFKAAIEGGVLAVMTGHLYVPALEPQRNLPATLSERILSGFLRQELGYKGLLFTDAMNMRAITGRYGNQDAALRAFLAGVDCILFPPEVKDAFDGLLQGLKSGKISPGRLDASVRRILSIKARLDLHRSRNPDLARLDEIVGNKEHLEMAQRIIENAITLVKDDQQALPLKVPDTVRILHLNLIDGPNFANSPGQAFRDELKRRYKNLSALDVRGNGTKDTNRLVEQQLKRSDAIVVTTFFRTTGRRAMELPARQTALLRKLAKGKKPLIFALFGSPYLMSAIPELPSCILAYEYYPEAELAVLRAILGEIPFHGKLPVQIPGLYRVGYALKKS